MRTLLRAETVKRLHKMAHYKHLTVNVTWANLTVGFDQELHIKHISKTAFFQFCSFAKNQKHVVSKKAETFVNAQGKLTARTKVTSQVSKADLRRL